MKPTMESMTYNQRYNRLRRDPLCGSHPCFVSVVFQHNHHLVSADALRSRPILKETLVAMKSALEEFESVSVASKEYYNVTLANQMKAHPDKLVEEIVANRELFPSDRDWLYLKEKMLSVKGPRTIDHMCVRLQELAQLRSDVLAYREWRVEDGSMQWCLFIHTSLMKRVVKYIKEAKKILFVDSSASCDLLRTSLTFITSASSVGGLPVAIALHRCQTQDNYDKVIF